ncbi:MAG: hypothetical protein QM753_09605 [Thermomicrobiales bacterium]
MNVSPMLLDLLVEENQQAIAENAEYRRLTADAIMPSEPARFRQTTGRILISLGERIGGIHRDALAQIATERPSTNAGRIRRVA